MKKDVHILLTIVLFLATISLFAQHTSLYFPVWNELYGTNCNKVTQIESNQNFYITNSPTFNGNRFMGDCSINEDQVFTEKGEYKFPAMLPLIIEAEVPSGVNNVIWNITGSNVAIVSTPENSKVVSGNYAVTPVSSGIMKVSVENPYRVKKVINTINQTCEQLVRQTYSGGAFTKSNYFGVISNKQDRQTVKCFLYNKEFSVGPRRTFIVVMATQEGYVHVVATAKEKQADKQAIVSGRVHFVNMDPYISCTKNIGGGSCPQYNLVVSGGPVVSPIQLVGNNTVTYKVNITNKGSKAVDLSNVLLRIVPNGKWWRTRKYIFKHLSGTLNAKETKEMVLSSDKITINESNVPTGVGVLKATATIIYPTSPEMGKSSDLDLTYTYKEINKKYSLAGILTNIEFDNYHNNLQLQIVNTANMKYENATLFIKSVTVKGQPLYEFANEKISASENLAGTLNSTGTILIQYYFKYTVKNSLGNDVTQTTDTYTYTIKQ
jgi:hypothetical protein